MQFIVGVMGPEEVLVRTRDMGWVTDTHLYASHAAFGASSPGASPRGRGC